MYNTHTHFSLVLSHISFCIHLQADFYLHDFWASGEYSLLDVSEAANVLSSTGLGIYICATLPQLTNALADLRDHPTLSQWKLLRFYNKKHITKPESIKASDPAYVFGVWVVLFGHKTFNFNASWKPTNTLNLTAEQVHLIDIPYNPTSAQDLRHLPAQLSARLKTSSHPLPRAIYGLVLTSFRPPRSLFSPRSSSSSPSSSPAPVPPLSLRTLYDAHPNYCIGAIPCIISGIIYFFPLKSTDFENICAFLHYQLGMAVPTDEALERMFDRYSKIQEKHATNFLPWAPVISTSHPLSNANDFEAEEVYWDS